MTLASNYQPIRQLGNGNTKSFSFDFNPLEEQYIIVYREINESQEVIDKAEYTVSFNDTGGTIDFKTAPAAGVYIVIAREVPLDQETPYKTSSGFPADRVEENLDKLTAITQQINDAVNRSPKLPVGVTADLALPNPCAGKALVWNESENGFSNSQTNLDEIETTVTEARNIAVQKAVEASENASAAEQSNQQAQMVVNGFDSHAAEKQAEVDASAEVARKWAVGTIEEQPLGSAEYWAGCAKSSSFGNIGDIKGTYRTDVPNGGVWADGGIYDQSQFPDFYIMLVNHHIANVISFSEYENQLTANNGVCGFYGLDTTNTKFRVPLIKDVMLQSTLTAGDIGKYQEAGLPDLVGNLSSGSMGFVNTNDNNKWNGVFEDGGNMGYGPQAAGASTQKIKFRASAYDNTYGKSSTVQPRAVKIRYYCVLYSDAAEASVAQAAEFINAVSELRNTKLNVDLSNLNFASLAYALTPDYTAGIDIPGNRIVTFETYGIICCMTTAGNSGTLFYRGDSPETGILLGRAQTSNSYYDNSSFNVHIEPNVNYYLQVVGNGAISNTFYPYHGVIKNV